ncbi:MAG: hypothetical protein MK179_12810 [Pirellulaceae bacterium]|nr:hypothetical protein [Pirellulaceae bacterium]
MAELPRYLPSRSYTWNYENAPDCVEREQPEVPGEWNFCGLPVNSPLGIAAGPLLNGQWCLYYGSLGFDVVTYKTVRSRARACYDLPNLQPVDCTPLHGDEPPILASDTMQGSWAISFGMPSQPPDVWREDIESTRKKLAKGKLLSVSVVGTTQDGWSIADLANDYAQCANWAVQSGADCVELNLSCPNVTACEGQLFQRPADAALVAAATRDVIGSTPLLAKIGFVKHEEDAASLIDALSNSVDCFATPNCVPAKIVDHTGHPQFGGQVRGIGGNAIQQASLAIVEMFADIIRRQGSQITLVGIGGISSAEHVQRHLSAGAHAVHMATAAMVEPDIAIRLRRELAAQS